jgi:hypothetical protein
VSIDKLLQIGKKPVPMLKTTAVPAFLELKYGGKLPVLCIVLSGASVIKHYHGNFLPFRSNYQGKIAL